LLVPVSAAGADMFAEVKPPFGNKLILRTLSGGYAPYIAFLRYLDEPETRAGYEQLDDQ
jgi:hypothetical protein